MKDKIKFFLRWFLIFILCFAVIYCIVFFGGWKLFESGDPILFEIGAALIFSVFVFSFNETVTKLEKRIQALEERINESENRK
ncbi:MAG: hypothetical protein IJA86_00355 [Clostridia bacterium]|nr:hypothetical protein [Clostridia bacterium]